MGLMQYILKGENQKGQIIKPDSTSFHKRLSTISGSESAVCRLLQIMLKDAQGLKQYLRLQQIEKLLSGWFDNFTAR